MAIQTPNINRIIRMNEFDLLITAISKYNMYMCLDSQKLYYDQSDSQRVQYNYIGVKTLNDLKYYITPTMNMTYYCWEDNSLWLWMNKWIVIYSDTTYPSGYVYTDDNYITATDSPSVPIDQNGLLKDGSVVIRDRNRIIKGKIYINDGNDNMVISSYLGGGLRLLPNGKMDTDGELYIDDDAISFIRAEWNVKNNEIYVDYTEKPETDENPFENDSHRYLVYHQGNLDPESLKVLTPQDIYDKLRDPSLPNPLDLNVTKLNGMEASKFALVNHTHIASNILDFNEKAREQAKEELKEELAKSVTNGLEIEYNDITTNFEFSANSFRLSLSGGVTGTADIINLSDTIMAVTVDPLKHIHQNLVDDIEDLQEQINDIPTFDSTLYYTKAETNILIDDIAATDVPTSGKPLNVNSNGILPGTSLDTTKFNSMKIINLTGDVTGTVQTDFSLSPINIATVNNKVSSTPQAGKALELDVNGHLPTNAQTASALDHLITINLTGGATGTGTLNTALNTLNIPTTLNVPSNILSESDIGTLVPGLDASGKVPLSQLPEFEAGLIPQGVWDPNTGAPSTSPEDGYFWIANAKGEFDGDLYYIGDWCLYLHGEWNYVEQTSKVTSVNGQTGPVTLTSESVGAISNTYIDYTAGETIPANKVVKTTTDGRIQGATVDKLTEQFELLTNSLGDVVIDAASINTTTDGSEDLNINLKFTETGYNNIKANTSYKIKDNDMELDYRPTINFKDGLSAVINGEEIDISLINPNDLIYLYWNGVANDETILRQINEYFPNRMNKPIIIYQTYGTNFNSALFKIVSVIIDSKTPDNVSELTLRSNHVNNEIYYTSPGGYYHVQSANICIKLEKDGSNEFNIIKNVQYADVISQWLPIGLDRPVVFIPTYDCEPTSKKYVDDQIKLHTRYSYSTNVNISGTTVSLVIPDTIEGFTPNRLIDLELNQAIKGTAVEQDLYTMSTIEINGTTYNFNANKYFANGTEDIFQAESLISVYVGENNTCYLSGIPYQTASGMEYYKTTIGNGVLTSIDVTHNLNTIDIMTEFRDDLGNKIYLDDKIKDANTITISAVNAIPLNGVKVTVLKI